MHAEMPGISKDGTPNVGLQLWVDLPSELKFCEPRYRDLRAEEIPVVTADEGRVKIKVISGVSHGVESVRDLAYTPVWILDVAVKKGGRVVQGLPVGWNAFIYTLEGSVVVGERKVGRFHNVVFEQEGDGVEVSVEEGASEDARFGEFSGLMFWRFVLMDLQLLLRDSRWISPWCSMARLCLIRTSRCIRRCGIIMAI